MTVKEFMEKYDVTRRTVYRWIEDGEVQAQKIGGKWYVEDMKKDDNSGAKNYENIGNDKTVEKELRQQIKSLTGEIEYLRQENTELRQNVSEMQKRHDTIVLSLSKQLSEEKKKLESRTNELYEEQKKLEDKTNQLSEKQKLIEELRNQTIWRRLKIALGFSSM